MLSQLYGCSLLSFPGHIFCGLLIPSPPIGGHLHQARLKANWLASFALAWPKVISALTIKIFAAAINYDLAATV